MLLSPSHSILATDVDTELELLDSLLKLAESKLSGGTSTSTTQAADTEHGPAEGEGGQHKPAAAETATYYNFDLLDRRHRSFVLWLPSIDPNRRAPQLIIGTLESGDARFKQLTRQALIQSSNHPELWELSPVTLGLPLRDGVYHYWFEVQDTSSGTTTSNTILVTDPFAYTVDYRILQQPETNEGHHHFPQPASVIRYRDGCLWPCDIDGREQRRVRTSSMGLPPNNQLVMYELPVSWTRADTTATGEQGGGESKIHDVGTFADVQALFDDETSGAGTSSSRGTNSMHAILSTLGINGLQLLPVTDSATQRGGWGYATANYFAADADLGSASDLARLVESLAASGVRLFTEVVTSFGFDPYRFADFSAFHIRPVREPSNPDSYMGGDPGFFRSGYGGELWRFVSNTTMTGGGSDTYDPETGRRRDGVVPARAFHRAHLARWMTDFGIGGLRLDAVRNTGSWDFLGEYRRAAWELYHRARPVTGSPGNDDAASNKFLVVGDGAVGGGNMLAGDGDTTKCLDALCNEPWQVRLRAVILGQGAMGDDFEATVRKLIDCRSDRGMGFRDGAQAVNYITSHDVEGYGRERLSAFLWNHGVGSRESASETERRAKLAFACLLTSVGIPMILSGEEFCDEHDDRDMRNNNNKQVDPVGWERLLDNDGGRYPPWRRRLFDYVATLVRLRTTCPALGENDTDIIHMDQSGGRKIVAWRRGGGGAPSGSSPPIVVVANFSDEATPGLEYVVPNWPAAGQERHGGWREVTQNRAVPKGWVGREALDRWEAKVYVVG
ncbi:putative alpha amylase [Chaetomidium leptoderma]|uniref:Alpha amylase n=1 Tax=Chaetomidium leptoderma TaxID=669021 RepID=A0AAN6VH42_9PEZI|nr:putative alpha amylase [Chaetomidium leptoderma]